MLSDHDRRAEYDNACARDVQHRVPLSSSIDFMDNLEGETNRRLAVLAVLYYRRRTNPHKPEVALQEIESRMGFPRDYLDFTTWYLTRKGYIQRADNSDFTLTAQGVDYVETQRVNIPVLNKLLTSGTASDNETGAAFVAAPAPIVVPTHTPVPVAAIVATVLASAKSNGSIALAEERRLNSRDRRTSTTDRRGRGATDRRSKS